MDRNPEKAHLSPAGEKRQGFGLERSDGPEPSAESHVRYLRSSWLSMKDVKYCRIATGRWSEASFQTHNNNVIITDVM